MEAVAEEIPSAMRREGAREGRICRHIGWMWWERLERESADGRRWWLAVAGDRAVGSPVRELSPVDRSLARLPQPRCSLSSLILLAAVTASDF